MANHRRRRSAKTPPPPLPDRGPTLADEQPPVPAFHKPAAAAPTKRYAIECRFKYTSARPSRFKRDAAWFVCKKYLTEEARDQALEVLQRKDVQYFEYRKAQ